MTKTGIIHKKQSSPIKKIIISALLLGGYPFIGSFLGRELDFIGFIVFLCCQILAIFSFYDFIKWSQKKWIKLLLIILFYSLYINFLNVFVLWYCNDCTPEQLTVFKVFGHRLIIIFLGMYVVFTGGAILYDIICYFIKKVKKSKK